MSVKKISAIDLRAGFVIKLDDNSVWKVVSSESSGTGRGANYTKLLIRNLQNDTNKDLRMNPEQKVVLCVLEHREFSFSYELKDEIVCIDDETGEETYFSKLIIKKDILDLITDEGLDDVKIIVQYLDDEIFKISLPKKIRVKIFQTEPYVKGQTVTSSYKPAILRNGWTVLVPQFIENDIYCIIDSETKEYTSKAE